MAVKIALATGNFLTAGTWGVIDATSYVNSETTTTVVPTSYGTAARSASTTPGAITIRGLGIKLSVRTGTTGTMTVHVAKSSDNSEVVGTAVTINMADLPVAATADLNGGWIYFKFAGDVTLAGATGYEIEVKTSSSSQASVFNSGASTALSGFLQTTTTGAPAVADDLIITGIHTTTGAPAAVTVTMDALAGAITDYGAASTSLVTPSLAIGNSGSLTYGATGATNYYLRQSGNVIVYSGGTLNIGTVATAMPRNSSAILNFDSASNVDFGLTVRNLGTFVAQGLSRTVAKLIVSCKLNTNEAIASTSLGVDTDTGWLDNDAIAVASTTRTATDCESGTMNGAANASDLPVDGFAGAGGGLAVAHSGTSPTQAEVILLTRNVQIFGASASLQGYIDIKATAIITIAWTEFKWLGSATANKVGIGTACTTGVQSFTFCSIHDFTVASSIGLNMTGASGTGLTFSNNVSYNNALFHFTNVANSGSSILDSNIFIKNSSGNIITLVDVGGTFTNNTIVGSTAVGLLLNEASDLGTYSGNILHSNTTNGLSVNQVTGGTISTTTIWRNSSSGLRFSGSCWDIIFSTLTLFGNTTSNIDPSTSSSVDNITFISLTSNGDTTFSTTNGINTSLGISFNFKIINGDFGTVTGIKAAHTNDINISAASASQILLNNTILASANEVATQTNLSLAGFISSEKHDQTAGLHKTWKKYGTLDLEATITHTGSQSLRALPNNATLHSLETSGAFGGFKVQVANGQTCTPSVYVYESAAYNGGRTRLVLKRNDAMGITADTVIDTRTGAADAVWELMTGATAAVTDDGTLEFVIDGDNTSGTGYFYVDSFSATVA